MQVSQVNSNVTAAVIGSRISQSFRVSESPEFFHILSSSLYSNPKLAVIREILCNAWDAHKVANVTQPVKVSVNSTQLIIQDFGEGIAPESMADIYGVYGASTKQNDSNQTGGFGLGCKAPFAYTDSFEVTSCHKGTKTVYQMLKASTDTDGLPAIIQVVQLPTEETGLTVKIPVKSVSDALDFKDIVKSLANVAFKTIILNDIEEEPELTGFPLGFAQIHVKSYACESGDFYIKYGDVLYPAQDQEFYHKEYTEVRGLMLSYYYHTSLVIEAEPNSLVITPSREAFQYCAKTLNTIKALLNKVIKTYKEIARDAHKVFLNIVTQKPIDLTTDIADWYSFPGRIVTYEDACIYWTVKTKNLHTWLFSEVFQHKFPDKKYLVKGYFKAKQPTVWVIKHILRPLLQKGINLKNFNRPKCSLAYPFDVVILAKTVFLYSKRSQFAKLNSNIQYIYAYKVTSAKNAKEVAEIFTSAGWTVNTSLLDYATQNSSTKRTKRSYRIPVRYTVWTSESWESIYSNYLRSSNGDPIEFKSWLQDREYVLLLPRETTLYPGDYPWVYYWIKKHPQKVVFVTTQGSLDYCKKLGMKGEEEIIQEIQKELSVNQDFIQYMQNNLNMFIKKLKNMYIGCNYSGNPLVNNIYTIPGFLQVVERLRLHKQLNLPDTTVKLPNDVSTVYTAYKTLCRKNLVPDVFTQVIPSTKLKKAIKKLVLSNLFLSNIPSPYSYSEEDCSIYVDWLRTCVLKRSKYV